MTEAEAVEIIRYQLLGAQGFVARLGRGEGVDRAAIEVVREALDSLRDAWANRGYVAKTAVLPLADVWASIHTSAKLYPDLQSEIDVLADDLSSRVRHVFLSQSGSATEEEAMATVWAHFSGAYSFLVALHERSGLDREAVEEVQRALATLERAWADRVDVPKTVVGTLLDARSAVLQNAGWYPELRRELDAIADDLAERVRRCLGDRQL